MPLSLYPPEVHEGDKTPDIPPEIDDICQAIHDAMKGFGTNEKALLTVMGKLTPSQRCYVGLRYQQMFDKDLKATLKKECAMKRHFGTALQYLAVAPDTAEADMLNDACKGIGTDELLVISIICGRTNKEMDILKKRFFDRYTKDLGGVLSGELTGAMEALIFNALQADEKEDDPEFFNDDKMKDDMEKLYKMGQGKIGTNEAGIFKILCASPPAYLKKMNLQYADKYGYTLVKALETEMKGDAQKAALFMLGMKLKPYEQIAKLIDTACKGFGTNETILTSTLIRYQLVMKEVMLAHVELYSQTIQDRVKKEVGGDYETLLLTILGAVE